MRLQDLIEDIESADASGNEVIFWEEQYRGSPAAYEIEGWDFKEIEDEDADPILEDCPDCDGNGEIDTTDSTDGDDPDSEQCPSCDGDGQVESDERPTKTVLAVKINHSGYAPGGLREDF
jgi:DnaJ-class molecular chaperone